jgi:PRTRC genetic system protein B
MTTPGRPNGHSKSKPSPKPAALPAEAYDTEPRVALVLSDETAYVTRYERGLPASTIPVRLDRAAAALGRFGADTGLLPEGILFWQTKANRERLAVWVPPARRTLTFSATQFKALTIPLPGLVFVGQGVDYYVWAARRRPENAREPLFAAPLPNIFANGKVCAGTVQFPKCQAGTIWESVRLFFESGFNHDLEGARINGTDRTMDFLRGLQKARSFPVDRLVPAGLMNDVLGGSQPSSHMAEAPDIDEDDENDMDEDTFYGDGEEHRRADLVELQAEMME